MVKPNYRTQEQSLKEMVLNSVKEQLKAQELETDVRAKGVASKIVSAVEQIQKIKEVKGDGEKGGIACPTCHDGHVHVYESDKTGLRVKCTGPNCGKEYVLVEKGAEYQCTTCGLPLKKPEKDEEMKDLKCISCGGISARRLPKAII